jgi:DNA replication protein DnaC
MDLLDIPCMPCVHGIPESHWKCTFGDFDFTEHQELKKLTLKFLEGDFWLYLYGPPGRGKTHYAVALHRAMVAKMGWESAGSSSFVEWTKLTRLMRESVGDFQQDAMLKAFQEPDVLVIDDIIGKLTDFQVRTLEELVRERHSSSRRIVVTSNEPFDWFLSMFSAHEVSRIRSKCVALTFGGVDRRVT